MKLAKNNKAKTAKKRTTKAAKTVVAKKPTLATSKTSPAGEKVKKDTFQTVKKFVLKHYPNSTTVGRYDNGCVFYTVVNARGKSVVNPSLLIPPATSVRKAWENAKYSIWFMNKLNKTRATDESKIYKTLSKED